MFSLEGGQNTQELFVEIKDRLDEFEENVFSLWISHAPEIISNNLNETLIHRVDEKNIKLNFTEELELTLREVRYFHSYGFKNLPESLTQLIVLTDDLWVRTFF